MSSDTETDADGYDGRTVAAQRLDAFVDAAFAFAVSLLIISGGQPPQSLQELRQALLHTPAFAASFALIALFWNAHRRFGAIAERRDAVTLLLSLAIVFVVLVYVFPLRVLNQSALHWFSGGALPGRELLSSFEDLALLYTLYGVGFAILSALYAVLFLYGRRAGARLRIGPTEQVEAGDWAWTWIVCTMAGVLSAALAQAVPMERAPWLPGFAYWVIPLAIGARGLLRRRGREASR